MGKVYEGIDERIRTFIEKQHVFFVSTAPLASDGHVNVSPKGLDSFAVLGPRRVAYLDLVGSGVETLAHLRENGRIVLLFCAFEGPPKIVRLHGRGTPHLPGEEGFATLREGFSAREGVRSIIEVELTRISDSCGYGVPQYAFQGERTQLPAWVERKEEGEGVAAYQRRMNAQSIDGLPGIES